MPSRKPPPPQRAAHWSDGETSALIGSWGPLHRRRRSRRLAAGEWSAAASAVNAHRAATGRRSDRTRAQCQRRVQSLKARYKAELARRPPSGWRHFPRLRAFLANPADGSPPGSPVKLALASLKEEAAAFLANLTGGAAPGFPAKAPASVKEEEEEEDDDDDKEAAFLASLIGGAPPGFPAKASASIKKEEEAVFLASLTGGAAPGFQAKAPLSVKEEEDDEEEEAAAFLASLIGGGPPGFPAKAPASVKKEEEGEVVPDCGMAAASWTVPTRRPRNESPGHCPAAVVTKLAEVYRSVELARLDLEKHKMERQMARLDAVKTEK
ncbi:hypothetical protein ACP4OV_004780 [Aristida adscensionis]